MALSPRDLRTLLELVRSDPEARRQFQSVLEMDALLDLPSAVDRVDRRLDRLSEVITELGVAQRRTEERVNELTEAQRRTEERVNELAEAQKRTEERVNELAEAQRRTEAVVAELAEAQKRTEARLERLEAVVNRLAESVEQMLTELTGLSRWQRGEEGRRKGEVYERRIQRNAAMLLLGGQGGSPEQSIVQERLSEIYRRLPPEHLPDDDASPSLADIVWWKGESYAVVEISITVDRHDIARAVQRAEVLRRGGISVIPLVIGEEWAGIDTEEQTKARNVEWKVGNSLSPGFIDYRRLDPAA